MHTTDSTVTHTSKSSHRHPATTIARRGWRSHTPPQPDHPSRQLCDDMSMLSSARRCLCVGAWECATCVVGTAVAIVGAATAATAVGKRRQRSPRHTVQCEGLTSQQWSGQHVSDTQVEHDASIATTGGCDSRSQKMRRRLPSRRAAVFVGLLTAVASVLAAPSSVGS
jgi:hypothetical protein